MSRPEIEIGFRNDRAYAEHCMREHGQVMPMFILHTDAETLVIPMQAETDRERDYVLLQIAAQAGIHNAWGVTFFSEGWLLAGAAVKDHFVLGLSPSQSRKRIEVLTIGRRQQMPGGIETRMSCLPILRDADGKFTGLGPDAAGDNAGEIHARSLNVLPHAPLTDKQRAIIRDVAQLLEDIGEDGDDEGVAH